METFSSFSYLVRNDFIYKDKVEIRVFFIYLDKGVVNKSLFLNKVNNKPERLYIADAKKIISKMIDSGALEKYAKENIKHAKRKKTGIAFASTMVGALAIAGIATGTYFLLHPPIKPWYLDRKYINSLTKEDVTKEGGEINTIEVNGLQHKVRLIGVDEDVDTEGNTIHTTWEFANLISDCDGYSLALQWNDMADENSANKNYRTSTLRNALIGKNVDNVHWAQKGATSWSNDYKCSVSDMLNKGNPKFTDALKTPKKIISIYNEQIRDFEDQVINDKIFLLAAGEVGDTYRTHEMLTPYSYYANRGGDLNSVRIKKQINEDNLADPSIIGPSSEQKYDGNVTNYAGHNFEASGGYYWLRSPYVSPTGSYIWRIWHGGDALYQRAYNNALSVAPAFCL